MMQRWRGCGTLELARALAIGRSANHSFGNNRLHTLHTKDIHASLSKNRPDPGAASPPISTYDPETSSISPSTNPLSSLFHFRFQDPIQTSLPFRLQGKRNRLVPMYESLHDRWTITISPLRFYPTCFELDKFLDNGIERRRSTCKPGCLCFTASGRGYEIRGSIERISFERPANRENCRSLRSRLKGMRGRDSRSKGIAKVGMENSFVG